MKLGPGRISVIYLTVSCIWITLSDKVLFLFEHVLSPTALHTLSSGKGLVFVFLTAILLWHLMRLGSKRLAQSEQQYRFMYEGSPLPKLIYNAKTLQFVSVNQAAVKHYGYSREEFLKMSIADILPERERKNLIDVVQNPSNSTKYSGNLTQIKAGGNPIFVNINWQQIQLHGEPHIIITAQDVTDKVIYQKELQKLNQHLIEQKERLSETQRIARIGGWEFYLENQLLLWSDEMYTITDVPPHENLNLFNLYIKQIHPEDRPTMTQALNELVTMGKPFDMIHRIKFLDGRVRYIRQLARLEHKDGAPYKVVGSAQDITELKQLEQERNKYLISFEDTLNSISEGFYTLSKDLVFTKVNKKFEIETGLSARQVIEKELKQVFTGIEGRIIYRQYIKAITERTPVKFEAYWRNTKKWHYIEAFPTEDGLAVYFNDITEKKEKDMQLEQAVSRYEAVAKATQDIIYDYDIINDKITFYTDVSTLLNCTPMEVGNNVKWWRSLVHPEDRMAVAESQQRVMHEGGTHWRADYRIACGEGNYKHVYSQGYYFYSNAGEPLRIIGALKDVDELKRVNDENKRLADIITKVNNMIIVMDVHHQVTWANKAFEDYAGYKLDDIKGKQPQEFLGAEKIPAETLDEIALRKQKLETFSMDIMHHLKNGITQWVNIEYTPLFNDCGKHTGYIAVHKNITERKRREEKIYMQNKVMQEISWLSSHEIRKPVASILGLAYLAKDVVNSDEKDEIIEMINQCAGELDDIVHVISNRISGELYNSMDNIAIEQLK